MNATAVELAELVSLHSLDEASLTVRRISVVVPMYNEASNVEALYARLVRTIQPLCRQLEILCVDDGSSDETFSILQRLHLRDERVRAIRLSRNFGKEIAMTAGLDRCRGDLVVILDADLQHPPESVPAMLAKLEEGYDVVCATRRSRRGQGLVRRLLSDGFHRFFRLIGDIDTADGAGDFRIMRRRVVLALRNVRESQRYMKGLFAWAGFRMATVPFDQEARPGDGSRWSLLMLLELGARAVTSFSIVPIRLVTILGLVLMVCASAIGLVNGMLFVRTGRFSEWAIVAFVAAITTAIQTLSLGIVGEYVGQAYVESKRRPLYVVRDVLGKPRRTRARG